jgi:hypothetical protein
MLMIAASTLDPLYLQHFHPNVLAWIKKQAFTYAAQGDVYPQLT